MYSILYKYLKVRHVSAFIFIETWSRAVPCNIDIRYVIKFTNTLRI